MSVCTFFGHSACYGLEEAALRGTIVDLIERGADVFYVGHQGGFDTAVYGCLKQLRKAYPHIVIGVVLAYLPTRKQEYDPYAQCSMHPEELEAVHPKFAIERRNLWMIERATYCVCYVNHTWGGAWKFSRLAKRRGLTVINLGAAEL